MPGLIIIDGVEYTNTNPVTTIKESTPKSITYLILQVWSLPNTEEIVKTDPGFWTDPDQQGFQMVWEIYKLNWNKHLGGDKEWTPPPSDIPSELEWFNSTSDSPPGNIEIKVGQPLYLPFSPLPGTVVPYATITIGNVGYTAKTGAAATVSAFANAPPDTSGLSYFIKNHWELPEGDELPSGFYTTGAGFQMMWKIYELNWESQGWPKPPKNPPAWDAGGEDLFDGATLKNGEVLTLPSSTVDEVPDVETKATGPAHDQAIPSQENLAGIRAPGATHYIYHSYLDDPTPTTGDHLYTQDDEVLELGKEGVFPYLSFEIDVRYWTYIGESDLADELNPPSLSGLEDVLHRAMSIIPWYTQVKVVDKKTHFDGTVLCKIEPPEGIPKELRDATTGQLINPLDLSTEGLTTFMLTALTDPWSYIYKEHERQDPWPNEIWLDSNLLVRFEAADPSLPVAPPPPGPSLPVIEMSFELASGDNWVSSMEEIEPHLIDYDPSLNERNLAIDEHYYIIKVNTKYEGRPSHTEEQKKQILYTQLKEAQKVGVARLLKFYGKKVSKNYVDAAMSGPGGADVSKVAKYYISPRPSSKRLSALVAIKQKYFDRFPAWDLHKWMNVQLGLVKVDHVDEDWYTFGLTSTIKKVPDVHTINYYAASELKENALKVADILERFDGPIESFKHKGGDVRVLNCRYEAQKLRESVEHIERFLQFPGQGRPSQTAALYQNSDAGSTSLGVGKKVVLGDNQIEIALDTALNLVYISYDEFVGGKSVHGVIPFIVGLDYLREKIKDRTWGFLLYSKAIITYMDSKAGPGGLRNESGTAIAGSMATSITRENLSFLQHSAAGHQGDPEPADGSTDEWIDFVSKFVFPIVVIRPSKKTKDPKFEECVEKMQRLDRVPVKTESEKLLEDTLLADNDCKKLILEERRKVKEKIGDPSLDPETVSWLAKLMGSPGAMEIHKIYSLVMNEVDIKTYAEAIIKCLLEKWGLPVTPEAICEMIINYLVSDIGIQAFSALLYSTPKTRKLAQSDQFKSLLAEVAAQNPSSAFATPGDGTGITAAPQALADGVIEGAEAVQQAAQVAGNQDSGISAGARDIGYNAQQVQTFVEGIKEFANLRRLCEDLVATGLDLPGKWLSGDFTLPEFGDILPKIPNPPVLRIPSFWEPKNDSRNFWKDVLEAMIDVLTTQLTKAIKLVLEEFLKSCLEEEDSENPEDYGRLKNEIPGFGPQSGPAPRAVFDAYGMLNQPDRIKEFLGRIADMLTTRELCNLLEGQPSDVVLGSIIDLVIEEFPEYSAVLSRKDEVRIFFEEIGSQLDLSICEDFEALMAVSEDFCNDLYNTEAKCQALKASGIPEEDCARQVEGKLKHDLSKLKGLANLLQMDAKDYLKDLMPPFDCSKEGVFPGLPPGLQKANDAVINSIFDNVLISFYRELRGMEEILKDLNASNLEDIAGAAEAFELVKWVGKMTPEATSGDIKFNPEWTEEMLMAGTDPSMGTGFLKDLDPFALDLIPLPFRKFPIKKLEDSLMTTEGIVGALLPGMVKSDEPLLTLEFPIVGHIADIPNTLPESIMEKFGGIVGLPPLTGPTPADKFLKNTGGFITFEKYFRILNNKDNFYWHKAGLNKEDWHFFSVPREDQEAGLLLQQYKSSMDFIKTKDAGLGTALDIIYDTIEKINKNNKDLLEAGGQGRSILYHVLDREIPNKETGELEPASAYKIKILDNRKMINYDPVKLHEGSTTIKDIPFKSNYPEEYKTLVNNLGLEFNNTQKAFGQFMTKKIEEYVQNTDDTQKANYLGGATKEKCKEFFIDYAHPLITQKLFDGMIELNRTSPAFELRSFEKIWQKLFPNNEVCWPENPEFDDGLLAISDLKKDIHERLRSALCKEFSDLSKKKLEPGLRPIEKASIFGLIITRIRIGIIEEIFYFMPLIPIYNFKHLMFNELFIEQAFSRIETGFLQDEARIPINIDYLGFVFDQAREMMKDALGQGHGKTKNHPDTMPSEDQPAHTHSYTIDDNGFGYAEEIIEGEFEEHTHIIKDYLVQFADKHLHKLEQEHQVPTGEEAFKSLLKQEYSEVIEIVWNIFKSTQKKHKLSVPRVENYSDLFKHVTDLENLEQHTADINSENPTMTQRILGGPIKISPATDSYTYVSGLNSDPSTWLPGHMADWTMHEDFIKPGATMPPHVIDKGVRYKSTEFWKQVEKDFGPGNGFQELLRKYIGGGDLMHLGDETVGPGIWDFPGTFLLEPYIWIDHKDEQQDHYQEGKHFNTESNLYNLNRTPPEFLKLLKTDAAVFDETDIKKIFPGLIGGPVDPGALRKLHEYGVCDIETWSKIFANFDPGKTTMGHTQKDVKINDYFNNLCFGLRLVYLFPLYDASNKDESADTLTKKTAQKVCDLMETIDNDISSTKILPDGTNLNPGNIGQVSFVHKAFLGATYDSKNDTEDYAFTKIPLIDVKIPVWKLHPDTCTKSSNDLKFSHLSPSGNAGIEPEEMFLKTIFNTIAYDELIKNLYATDDFKFLFKYVFPYDTMLTLNALHASYANTDIGDLSTFSATKTIILTFMQNLLAGAGDLADNVPFFIDFRSFAQFGGDSSTAGNFPNNPFGDQLKALIKETPKLILKALVEITDPCVMTGKGILDAVKLIIETSLKVAEEIEKAAFDTVKTVVDFNKGLIGSLFLVINQSEMAVKMMEDQIKGLPTTTVDQQAFKQEKETELENFKQEILDKKALLVEAQTLIYGEYVGKKANGGTTLEKQYPKDDYPDLWEMDWIKPPETKVYLAPNKNPETKNKDEVGIVPAKLDDPRRLAWPGYEDKAIHEMAALDLTFKVVVRKTKKTMALIDPYLLPLICIILFPANVPYGGAILGFPPPPAGPGIGPPLTPLGFIYLIMVTLGFLDDYEKWLKREVDDAETEIGIVEEGEEC